uniref:LDLR chaperone boca-like n=2 Tax=Hirondellea gigas TaxID=1518452 RepID=A0A2P2I0N1_9CRUS
MAPQILLRTVFLVCIISVIQCRKHDGKDKPKWAKKDIGDYNEVDMERLLDQWEEDEEPLEPDELPEHLRPPPKIQFDPSAMNDPEQLLQMSKKGKTLMMFVKAKDKYTRDQVEAFTKLWQSALHNNHVQAERYMVDDHRAIFMFSDGSQAWEAKDFLVEQEELQDCAIDNRVYHGHHTPEGKQEARKKKTSSGPSKKKKKEEL